ncbi:MAG: CPBP family intramembrane metalloprotease [Candidatus Cohnella colombiensis]|uniref:CPBP family intramembrane metalloprotease n=1 Tax=Candidatus Cohnella colombiensis TaxID=3121368 RepID=A0AA95EV91_9BACL|nr:MAG: CPBP family intramembrane metalloprotease [Cohnella sp.]
MSSMNKVRLQNRWLWVATVGFILFLLLQVFPISGQFFTINSASTLTRSEVENRAYELAESQFGIHRHNVVRANVTHISNSAATGYLSKNELLNVYDDKFELTQPTDAYAVDLLLNDSTQETLRLYLHMATGDLTAWESLGGSRQTSSPLSGEQLVSSATDFVRTWGLLPSTSQWHASALEDGSVKFTAQQSNLAEANVWVNVRLPMDGEQIASWQRGAITYGIDLPESFTNYLKEQHSIAFQLSKYGYIVPHIILIFCAIVYAGSYSGFSTYKRGLFLSALFLVLYLVVAYTWLPGNRAEMILPGSLVNDDAVKGVLQVSIVIYIAMALLTYFSSVAGDGLWKSMGRTLWPRWRESNYGATVLQNMKDGYMLAFILLGAQSVLLLVLSLSIGSFGASDASQSTYNMTLPWLLPLLAWCAGISEELQSRFFGIALFRRWLIGGVKLVFRRTPSEQGLRTITFIAMVPPGLLWALGHVGYAVYPVYTRLIELVILALLFGWFMLRFGLITVIFAHVTLDAILMGVQLMFDGMPGSFYSGVFSLFMPALVGIAIWLLHGVWRSRQASI